MIPAVDLFTPGKYKPVTNSEYLDNFYNDNTYSSMAALVHGKAEHEAAIFVPDPKTEKILSDIEFDLSAWGGDYSKRRAIEKKTADYIRKKVVPTGLMGNAAQIADKLESCRNSGVLGFDTNSGRKIVKWKDKCGLVKLCPDEARAEQKRLARRYAPAVEAWLDERPTRRQFQYAVFEPVNIAFGNLKEGIRAAYHELRLMLRHESMQSVKGCFTALEAPMSKDGKTWNVHINCMFLVDGHFDWKTIRAEYGQRIHFKSTQAMIEATTKYLERRAEKTGENVQMSRTEVLLAAFREIIKYSSKHVAEKSDSGRTDAPTITEWHPEQFVEWYAAHKGLRRCRSYGVLFGIEEPEREPLNVQWIGTMDYTGRQGYEFAINRRPSIISLQGDKLTNKNLKNSKQTTFFKPAAPPG